MLEATPLSPCVYEVIEILKQRYSSLKFISVYTRSGVNWLATHEF